MSAARQPKVLIIEDEPLIALDLSSILEEVDCQICGVAESADDAVAIAERERIDLILADIRINGEADGITAVQRIRERSPVPVLFISSYWPELRKRGMGDAMVIGKPFLPVLLKQAIREALSEGVRR